MAATTTQAMGSLPSGLGICTTAPDIFYLPELVSVQWQRTEQLTLKSVMKRFFPFWIFYFFLFEQLVFFFFFFRNIWFSWFLLNWFDFKVFSIQQIMQQTAISWQQWTDFVLNVFISKQVSHSYNVWQKITLILVVISSVMQKCAFWWNRRQWNILPHMGGALASFHISHFTHIVTVLLI